MNTDLRVTAARLTPASPRLERTGMLGWVAVQLNGAVELDGITLRRTRGGRLALSFPARTDDAGQRHPYVRPLHGDAREAFERQVLDLLWEVAVSARNAIRRVGPAGPENACQVPLVSTLHGQDDLDPEPVPEPREGDRGAVPGAPQPDVHERVERRLRRAGALLGQLAQICRSLADDVGEVQLAAAPDPRLMSSVEPTPNPSPPEAAQSAVRPLLGVPELAAILAVDEATVRRWRRDGRLPAPVQVSGTTRWRREVVDEWLRAREESP